MRKPRVRNAWLAALLAWVLATCLVTGAYAVLKISQGQPFRWALVREAALFALPVALLLGWRDRNRQAG